MAELNPLFSRFWVELPSPHEARQSQAESPLLEHDLFEASDPTAPTGSWGCKKEDSNKKRMSRAEAMGTCQKLLAGWNRLRPWQDQTEVQQR